MTDHELLELAAKAAGIEIYWCESNSCYWLTDESDSFVPLDNDGDALRLAVKLGLCVKVDKRAGFTWIKKFEGGVPHNNDPYAATRRAIVRAAAAIGKGLVPFPTADEIRENWFGGSHETT